MYCLLKCLTVVIQEVLDGVILTGDGIRTIERNADVLLNACMDIGLAVNTGKTNDKNYVRKKE